MSGSGSRGVTYLMLMGLSSACPDGSVTPPPPPAAPRAFLTFPATTVVAPSVKGSLTTMGCQKVAQVQILESDTFLLDAKYSAEPTKFEIAPSLLNGLYSKRGFATSLSLTAKVRCEEGDKLPDGGTSVREGVSQPVSLQFLPVDSVRADEGRQTLPDSFVAEGGVGGQPTVFIGCVGTTSGTGLMKLDSSGTRLAVNETLPFKCDYSSNITDRHAGSNTRWLWVPLKGAFAFDQGLNVTSQFQGPITHLAVSPVDGDAIVTIEDPSGGTKAQLIRLRVRPAAGEMAQMWSSLRGTLDTGYPGSFNADPVVDPGTRRVFTSSWQYRMGSATGLIAVLVYNYDNGQLLTDPPPAILAFDFGEPLNRPVQPNGTFKEDGTLFYAPLLTVVGGALRTTVVACATNVAGCQNAARRWTSPTFEGELTTVVTFARGSFVAALGPSAAYFLGGSDGAVKNPGGMKPLQPAGSLLIQGAVAGSGNDFYLLNAAQPGINRPTFPTEIVAIDSPSSGELWRLGIQGGTQPADSLTLAVDDNGQAWMRVGTEQVKPLPLRQYRDQRGPTGP